MYAVTHSKKKEFRTAKRGDIYGLAVEHWEARSITPDLSTIPSFFQGKTFLGTDFTYRP
jgi:hypothetical protein